MWKLFYIAYYTVIKAYPSHLIRKEAKAPHNRLIVDDCREIKSMLHSFLLFSASWLFCVVQQRKALVSMVFLAHVLINPNRGEKERERERQ